MSRTLFNLPFSFDTRQCIREAIAAASSENPVRLATVNPEFILDALRWPSYALTLARMSHRSIDGTGLALLLRLARFLHRIPEQSTERYPGATLVADLFATYAQGERRFALLGGAPGVAARAAEQIRAKHPNIAIVSVDDGGLVQLEEDSNGNVSVRADSAILDRLNAAKPDILLVGFGAPKQELWIDQIGSTLALPVMIGVGGTFSFYTDRPRAPRILQQLGLEWLYRTFTVPGHWRRAWRAVVVFTVRSKAWLLTGLGGSSATAKTPLSR